MFGIQFEGHPDMRRILLPEEWEGFPLRKEYGTDPAGRSMGPGESKHRKRPVNDMPDATFLDSTELVLNMGPQHPSTHGVLRVILKLDGEKVLGTECIIGPAYAHRDFGTATLSTTEHLTDHTLILPLYHQMTNAEQRRIIDVLRET